VYEQTRRHSQPVATAFNSGNVDAILVPQAGQVARGRDAIRAALLQFLALKGTMRVKSVFTIHGQAWF
jgi:hypothetical protein